MTSTVCLGIIAFSGNSTLKCEQILWEKYLVTLHADPPVDGIRQVQKMQTLNSVNIQRTTNGRLTCKTSHNILGFPGGEPLEVAEQLKITWNRTERLCTASYMHREVFRVVKTLLHWIQACLLSNLVCTFQSDYPVCG